MMALTMRDVPMKDLPSAVLIDRIERGCAMTGDDSNAMLGELGRRGVVLSETGPGFVHKPPVLSAA
jgi:hypothetical protein